MMKQKFLQVMGSLQLSASLSLLIAFAGLYFYARSGHLAVLLSLLFLAVALSLWAHFRCRVEQGDRGAVWLLIGGYGVLALSLLCFAVRKAVQSGPSATVGRTALLGVAAAGLCAFEVYYLFRKFGKMTLCRRSFLRALPLLALCLLVLVLNLDNFGAWLRWDSYDYYYYISELSYDSITVRNSLRPSNHAAYGFSVIYLILDGLFGAPAFTLMLINVLMLLLGTCGVWSILQKRFGHWHGSARLAMTAIYAFSPFLLGLSWTVGLESFLIFGLVLFFWGEAKELPLLQTAAALLICFSKETGALALMAIMVARLAMNFFCSRKGEQSKLQKMELTLTVPVLLCGILWLADFLAGSWMGSNSGWTPTVEGVRFNTFGLNGAYLWDRLLSLLFSNFTWLLLVIVVAGFIVGRVRQKHVADTARLYFAVELTAAIGGVLLPLFLFVTYNHIRYASVFALLLVLLLPEALDRMLTGWQPKTALCGCVAVLCLIQSFWTVDPMMMLICNSVPKGGCGAVYYPRNSVLQGGNFTSSVSVRNQYNREILYFDRAMDELLAAIGYDENTVLLLSSEYTEPIPGGYVDTEYLIGGFGYQHMEKARYVAWDQESQRRYLSEDAADQIHVYTVKPTSDYGEDLAEFDRWVYVQMPFYDESVQERWWQGMTCTEIAASNVAGWRLIAYEMTKEN